MGRKRNQSIHETFKLYNILSSFSFSPIRVPEEFLSRSERTLRDSKSTVEDEKNIPLVARPQNLISMRRDSSDFSSNQFWLPSWDCFPRDVMKRIIYKQSWKLRLQWWLFNAACRKSCWEPVFRFVQPETLWNVVSNQRTRTNSVPIWWRGNEVLWSCEKGKVTAYEPEGPSGPSGRRLSPVSVALSD